MSEKLGIPDHQPNVDSEWNRLRAASASGSANAAELEALLKQLRGKSPQEALGVVARSGLAASLVIATIGTMVLLAIGTVVPYLWSKWPAGSDQAAGTNTPVSTESATPTTTPAPGNSAPNAPATAANNFSTPPTKSTVASKEPDIDGFAKKMGVGDVKKSDPRVNPLDDKGDDLFKDLK